MGDSRGKRPSAGDPPPSLGGRVGGPCGGSSEGPFDARSGVEARSGYLPRFFVDPGLSSAPFSSLPVPRTDRLGDELVLDPEDSRHALRVLRLGVGDACEVVVTPADRGSGPTEGRGAPAADRGGAAEGRGGTAYLATVTQATGELRVRLVARLEGREAGARYATTVGIVQALTRPAATDYLLEKGTEVGASFFFLVPVAGSTLRSGSLQGARLTRWRRIVREAAKQSKQLAVPPVEVMGSVEEALDRLGPGALSLVLEPGASGGLYDAVAAAWARGGPAEGAREAQRPPERPARLVLWVGPESGWTAEELEQLTASGAETVRLGQSVLRAETAGPVAVAVARLALGDW